MSFAGTMKIKSFVICIFLLEVASGEEKSESTEGSSSIEAKNSRTRSKSSDDCLVERDFGYCWHNAEFFFNQTSKRCEAATEGLCFGTTNQFESLQECFDTCQSHMNEEDRKIETSILSPDCLTKADRLRPEKMGRYKGPDGLGYYFNRDTYSCQSFTKCCDGLSTTSFTELKDCERTCLAGIKEEEAQGHLKRAKQTCLQPKNEGDIKPETHHRKGPKLNYPDLRFYYNNATERCEAFHFSGPYTNANNFATLKGCHENCQPLMKDRDKLASEISVHKRCLGPPEMDPCYSSFGMQYEYRFDKTTLECKAEIVHCSNEWFNSRDDCATKCYHGLEKVSKDKIHAKCLKPMDEPMHYMACKHRYRYTFDVDAMKCKKVRACNPLNNHYGSRKECESKCFK